MVCEFAKTLGSMWNAFGGWEALSAIGTLGATGVALFLPVWSQKKEWARQDQLKADDRKHESDLRVAASLQAKEDRKYVIHQGCSTVDQILAYWQATIELADAEPICPEGGAALRRIRENVQTLSEILQVLKNRPELSDGLLFTIVNAERVAQHILERTAPPSEGRRIWASVSRSLTSRRALVEITQGRNDRVRVAFDLQPSTAAEAIRVKYTALAHAIKVSQQPNAAAIDMTHVPQDHY